MFKFFSALGGKKIWYFFFVPIVSGCQKDIGTIQRCYSVCIKMTLFMKMGGENLLLTEFSIIGGIRWGIDMLNMDGLNSRRKWTTIVAKT
jgi:hypothetical protein